MKEAVRKFKETVEIRSSWVNQWRSHRYFLVTILIAAVLAASCLHVWQRVKVMGLLQEVEHEQQEHADLLDRLKKTRSQIASLQAASRIQAYARDSLGLELIAADRLLTLSYPENPLPPPDDLAALASAVKRVARYLPVVSPTSAYAGEPRSLEIDSSVLKGAGE